MTSESWKRYRKSRVGVSAGIESRQASSKLGELPFIARAVLASRT
jgi:hypothetical protein